MKKHIIVPALLAAAMFSANTVKAQEDVNPLLKYISKDETVKASIGGRMYADFAYYHSDWTPMKSGAAITDARIPVPRFDGHDVRNPSLGSNAYGILDASTSSN